MWCFTLYLVCASLGVFALEFKVEHAMKNAGIVPDVIPVAPKNMLHVSYPSGVKAVLGNKLTPTQVKDRPSVSWNYNPNSFYTLSFVDPDAPSRAEPKMKEVNHWLVGNIPGGNVNMGITLTDFIGSGPPQKSGFHRYVFLVYKQPSRILFDEPFISNRTAEPRLKFSIHKFALKYDLGTPVAGNFYEAQYDDYVPILHQQIGIKQINSELKASNYSSKIIAAMNIHKIVPDVIPVAPSAKLEVSFPSGVSAEMGNELTPTQVKDEPLVNWPFDSNAFYTICLTDPDAPSPDREWHHWLVGNIPGRDITKGETLSEYIGSGPPPNGGLHRYVILVYKQPSKLTFDEPRLTNRSAEKREKFSISKFAIKYKLGNPIAGNFFQAQYDNYVPLLDKQLGL